VAGTVVKAGGRLAITDKDGKYALALDTGRYDVAQGLPNDFLMRQICPQAQASKPVHIVRQLQSIIGQDFINESYDCPRMTLDFSPGRLRLCSKNSIGIAYKNEGTAPLVNARLRLFLPSEVIVIGSPIAFTRESDLSYTFSLGTIAAGQSGTFSIDDSISCSIPDTNQRVCLTARIEPMSICGQIATSQINWDGAWLDAKAAYQNSGPNVGKVQYQIVNRGLAMQDSVPMNIITENYYPAYSQKIKLGAGDSLQFYVQSGLLKSSHLYFQQTAGCPLGTSGSVGFAGQGPTPTYLSLKDGWFGRQTVSSCFPLRFSYDPNEKTVYPEKLAEPGQSLDYTIHFENMGNDSAYAVVVLDTLDANLDITKFSLLGSSHPCAVTLNGTETQPVLNFAFLPIKLPAKKQDSVLSKGFVNFSVPLRPNVARGTYVSNRASIYFDRNPSILTPDATVQVRPLNLPTTIAPQIIGLPQLSVYPNPSQGKFMVKLPVGNFGSWLEVRDLTGRIISKNLLGKQLENEVTIPISGFYILSVEGLRSVRVVVNP
jgi:uncharacterized repeat protein (TIGR01451 family)